jgi:hypothetical protein
VWQYSDLVREFWRGRAPAKISDPTSEHFFLGYREPVIRFAIAATALEDGVRGLIEGNPSALDNMRVGVGIRAVLVSGEIEQRPVYPSLIAALADMALRDYCGGFRLVGCRECGALTRTKLDRTAYCSKPCRWKAMQRAHRERLAQASERNRKKENNAK